MTTARQIRTVTLCLLIGAAFNYAFAWLLAALPQRYIALRPPVWLAPREHLSDRRWLWMFNHAPGPDWASTLGGGIDRWQGGAAAVTTELSYTPPEPRLDGVPDFVLATIPKREEHYLARGTPPPPIQQSFRAPIDAFADERAGWPCFALRHEVRTANDSPEIAEIRWGIALPRTKGRMRTTPNSLGASPSLSTARTVRMLPTNQLAALPLRPIWPGFAINTAIYAALTWLLLFVSRSIRRVLRRRRLRCERCGYDRRGLAPTRDCPECGNAAPCAPYTVST